MNDFSQLSDQYMPVILQYGMNVIWAIVILLIGWGAANWFAGRVKKMGQRSGRVDDTLIPILSKTTKVLILLITLLMVLNQFGVQTASIIAILGAAGLAVGLALQGTLTNIASGIMLLMLRPFRVGDAVDIDGTMGVIDEIGLFVTEMHSFDNIHIVLPNSQAWGSKIRNLSRNETRRVDMVMGIGYDDDMDKAIRIIKEVLADDERILADPEPLVEVAELADSSVNIYVRPWAKTADVWPLRFALTKRFKERFDEEGLNIPYPQRDVHLFQDK